ncbi:hypothetical protein N9R79_09185 [Vibrio sp.]|nr:hypothetical protein [Vibrio sp.]
MYSYLEVKLAISNLGHDIRENQIAIKTLLEQLAKDILDGEKKKQDNRIRIALDKTLSEMIATGKCDREGFDALLKKNLQCTVS